MKSMKLITPLLAFFLVVSTCLADSQCRDENGNVADQSACENSSAAEANASALPEDVLAVLTDLDAKMRFFTAVGFHDKSKEMRDEITVIYADHGVPLPDKYKE